MKLAWCGVCGGRHVRPQECPGDLRATGTERHGWRVTVETPHGFEAYGVLVAPSDDLWRARILTYPNVLWTAPGGAVTIKFVGATPQDAEARAVAFVEDHIRACGYLRRDALDVTKVAAYNAEAQAKLAAGGPAVRKLLAFPVRFGGANATFSAMTANLSESGLFLVTMAPFEAGVGLRVVMDLENGPVGLRGHVVWKRERPVLGRPIGLGVRLVSPPDPYREFVLELP